MKAKEVMKLMNISRTTLFYYTKNGKIKVTKFDNGYYDYDEESVFKLFLKILKFPYTNKKLIYKIKLTNLQYIVKVKIYKLVKIILILTLE